MSGMSPGNDNGAGVAPPAGSDPPPPPPTNAAEWTPQGSALGWTVQKARRAMADGRPVVFEGEIDAAGAHSKKYVYGLLEVFKMQQLSKTKHGHQKLLRYDLKKLIQAGGIMTMTQSATIFTMSGDTVSSVTTAALAAALIAWSLYVFAGDSLLHMKEQHLEELSQVTMYMNSVVPFILGLYLSLCMTRWWALRTRAIGEICDSFIDLAFLIGAYFPGVRHQAFRVAVRNYGIASLWLTVQAARDEKNEDWYADLERTGLLTRDEIMSLSKHPPYQRAMTMYAWIMRLVHEAADIDNVPAPNLNTFQVLVCRARDGIQAAHTYLRTQLPFAYVHLIALLVHMNNILVFVRVGITVSVALMYGNVMVTVLQGVYVIIVPVVYQGLLSISYLIEDPFGDEILDFPITAYVLYVEQALDAIDPVCFPSAADPSWHAAEYRIMMEGKKLGGRYASRALPETQIRQDEEQLKLTEETTRDVLHLFQNQTDSLFEVVRSVHRPREAEGAVLAALREQAEVLKAVQTTLPAQATTRRR